MVTTAAAMEARRVQTRIRNIRKRRACGWRASVAIGSQGEREQRLLLNLVRLARSGRRAGAGGALHGKHRAVANQAPQARDHEIQSSHVGWLFLNPNDLGLRISLEFG